MRLPVLRQSRAQRAAGAPDEMDDDDEDSDARVEISAQNREYEIWTRCLVGHALTSFAEQLRCIHPPASHRLTAAIGQSALSAKLDVTAKYKGTPEKATPNALIG